MGEDPVGWHLPQAKNLVVESSSERCHNMGTTDLRCADVMDEIKIKIQAMMEGDEE